MFALRGDLNRGTSYRFQLQMASPDESGAAFFHGSYLRYNPMTFNVLTFHVYGKAAIDQRT